MEGNVSHSNRPIDMDARTNRFVVCMAFCTAESGSAGGSKGLIPTGRKFLGLQAKVRHASYKSNAQTTSRSYGVAGTNWFVARTASCTAESGSVGGKNGLAKKVFRFVAKMRHDSYKSKAETSSNEYGVAGTSLTFGFLPKALCLSRSFPASRLIPALPRPLVLTYLCLLAHGGRWYTRPARCVRNTCPEKGAHDTEDMATLAHAGRLAAADSDAAHGDGRLRALRRAV